MKILVFVVLAAVWVALIWKIAAREIGRGS